MPNAASTEEVSAYDSDSSTNSSRPDIAHNGSSLRSELKTITDTVALLENFKPEKTKGKAGRPKAAKASDISKIVSTLQSLCKLSEKILQELEQVQESLEKKGTKEVKLYSQVTTAREDAVADAVPPTTLIPNNLTLLDTKIDQIEQDGLTETIKLDGEVCEKIITDCRDNNSGDHSKLKELIAIEFNKIEPNLITVDTVVDANIIGREKKHIKIKVKSTSTKIHILKTFKQNRPTSFYANDYLTKIRAGIFHKLRALKKTNQKIKSTYTYNGNICCRLEENNKIIYLNTQESFDSFVVGIE